MASPLEHRGFRILWGGSILTFTAQWVQQVALGWVIYELTASTLMLGLILGIRAIPMLLLAPFSGVAADRYDRRGLLLAGQLSMALATGLLAYALGRGTAQMSHLIAFVLVVGAASVLDRNARHAIVLDLVPREQAAKAVALNSMAFAGARMAAPALAGYLVAIFGASANFLLQAIAYAAVAASLAFIRMPARDRPASGQSARAAMAEGLRFAMQDRNTRLLLATGVLPYFFLYPVWGTLFPAIAKDAFAGGPEVLGKMLAAVGLGGFLGGLAGAMLGRFDRAGRVQGVSACLIGIGLVGITFAPSVWIALPFVVLAGFGEMLYTVANQALVQLSTPAHVRGRVTSLLATFPAFISLGAIWLGALAEWIGALPTTGVAGVIGLAIGVAGVASRRMGALRLSQFRDKV